METKDFHLKHTDELKNYAMGIDEISFATSELGNVGSYHTYIGGQPVTFHLL